MNITGYLRMIPVCFCLVKFGWPDYSSIRNHESRGVKEIMEEKRISQRKRITITTVIKKILPDSTYQIMEFLSDNLSQGGVFILAEDLSLFDLGEEIEILVDIKGDRYYAGMAKVVRSARIFSDQAKGTQSGYGLMFLDPEDDFKQMLLEKLETGK